MSIISKVKQKHLFYKRNYFCLRIFYQQILLANQNPLHLMNICIPMAGNIVSFSDATIKQRGKTVLTNVSIDVPEGSFVFLIGRTEVEKASIKTIYGDLELAEGLKAKFDLTRLKKQTDPP